jgi:nicotinate-nucleotide adenylyltransferase
LRLGLLGGTFDPIHFGHLRAAESAREALGLQRVLFVTAGTPPHRAAPRTSAQDRFAMTSLATAGNEDFVASDVELQREGPSYTVDTVSALKAAHPADEVVLLVGADAYGEIGTWRERERLMSLCRVAVMPRPGEPDPGAGGALRVEGPILPISASDIRRRVHEGRSIRYLVPEGVAAYIAKKGLYR